MRGWPIAVPTRTLKARVDVLKRRAMVTDVMPDEAGGGRREEEETEEEE